MQIAFLRCGCKCLLDDTFDSANPEPGKMISIFTACSGPETAYKSEFRIVSGKELQDYTANIETVHNLTEDESLRELVNLNRCIWEADKFRRVKDLLQ